MIYGNIRDLPGYLPVAIRECISGFLQKASIDMEEGIYELRGQQIYARVMSYKTRKPEACRIEAHDKYIDIQSSLDGGEGISIFPREGLTIDTYNEAEDVSFYSQDAEAFAYCKNYPGFFTLLLPTDAHRPQENLCEEKWVKKYVIKVDRKFWEKDMK